MKQNLKFFLLLAALILIFLPEMSFSSSEQSLSQIVNISSTTALSEPFLPIVIWSEEFWLIFALIISETAALLPTKISGILQGIISGIISIFRKK